MCTSKNPYAEYVFTSVLFCRREFDQRQAVDYFRRSGYRSPIPNSMPNFFDLLAFPISNQPGV